MRWQQIVPVTVIVVLVGLLAYGLTRNPEDLPSALLDKPVPEFNLPTLASNRPQLTNAALDGQVTMINVWASWCLSCRAEHSLITEITRRTGVPVIGLNYKDTRTDAMRWLRRFGDPFAVIAFDKQGEFGFDLGVAAVPETFVVDTDGRIRHKVTGPMTTEIMNDTLIPLLQHLKQGA